jgi:hypothetical protein
LFTDTNMHDPLFREEIEEIYRCLQNTPDQLAIPSNNYDLVLYIMHTEDGQKKWSYYYACHETRCLFWLHTYDATKMISKVYGVKSPAHISVLHLSSPTRSLFPLIRYAEHQLEYLYWCVDCLLYSYFKH